jgi:hypothetical protein
VRTSAGPGSTLGAAESADSSDVSDSPGVTVSSGVTVLSGVIVSSSGTSEAVESVMVDTVRRTRDTAEGA